jgi:hypothetical protein
VLLPATPRIRVSVYPNWGEPAALVREIDASRDEGELDLSL